MIDGGAWTSQFVCHAYENRFELQNIARIFDCQVLSLFGFVAIYFDEVFQENMSNHLARSSLAVFWL